MQKQEWLALARRIRSPYLGSPRQATARAAALGVPILVLFVAFQNCGVRRAGSQAAAPPVDASPQSAAVVSDDTRIALQDPGTSVTETNAQLRFDPDLPVIPFNQTVSVNWSFGTGVDRANARGEMRFSGGGCVPGRNISSQVSRWPQVEAALKGAATLNVDPSYVSCTVSYCLISQDSGGSPRETCRNIQFAPGRPVIDVAVSATETAWDQEIAYSWRISHLENVTSVLRFDGSSCSRRGQSETLTGNANGSATLAVKAGDSSYSDCDARFCIEGRSDIDHVTAVSACKNIHYHPSTWRPQNWVRDSRYFYDANNNKTPHITWGFSSTPNGSNVEVAVGTMPGKSDLLPWTQAAQSIGVRYQLAQNFFQTGRTYFASARLVDSGGSIIASAQGNGWRIIRDDDIPRRMPDAGPNGVVYYRNNGLTEVVDDGFITVRDTNALRQRLIQFLWPQTGLPTQTPQEIRSETDIARTLREIMGNSAQAGIPDGAEIPQATASVIEATDTLTRLIVRNPAGLESHVFFFTPKAERRNRLAIFHHGHSDILAPYGGARTIDFFLRNGFDVLAFFMPANGPNAPSLDRIFANAGMAGNGQRKSHSDIVDLWRRAPEGTLGESPLAVFLSPIRIALNYVRSRQNYEDVTMTGVSGGGWTTTMYAAIDPQIKYSIPVAGSLPLHLRMQRPVDLSDDEQFLPEFYSLAGWLDLYILGASGDGRRQIQVLNGQDSCCFRPNSDNGSASYLVPFTNRQLTYSTRVAQVASENRGRFEVQVDSPADHTISNWTLGGVIGPMIGIPAGITLKMNGQLGSQDPNRRTQIRGNLDLIYDWNCSGCSSGLRSTFTYGGNCGTSADNAGIDWMSSPRGTFRVPGSASRMGCWINFTLTPTSNPSASQTFYFDWTTGPAPEITFRMNGSDGSRDPNHRTQIRGDLDLHYNWNCPDCAAPLRATYTFGGTCTGGSTYSDQPIEWIRSAQGQFDVSGSPSRLGCWINFNLYSQGIPAPQVFYFDWVR